MRLSRPLCAQWNRRFYLQSSPCLWEGVLVIVHLLRLRCIGQRVLGGKDFCSRRLAGTANARLYGWRGAVCPRAAGLSCCIFTVQVVVERFQMPWRHPS